jgi:hypothetical protein
MARFSLSGGIQNITVYNDLTAIDVASGNSAGGGAQPIYLYAIGGSGISGVVYWDGNLIGPLAMPVVLDCLESSSSSSPP